MAVTLSSILQQAIEKNDINEKSGSTIRWLRKTALQLTGVKPSELLNDSAMLTTISNKNNIGRLFIFKYDAKTKQKLKYWDKYPVVIVIDTYDDGFLGLNLHYLPPKYRAVLLDKLYTIVNNTKFDNTTKLLITYKMLKQTQKFQYFKPTIKRYLGTNVKSNYLYISPKHWDLALFLPIARWQKSQESTVWNDSKHALNIQ